jgi:LacI family transcriptional regulator
VTPALSTIRQPMQTLGASAAGLLLSLLAGDTPDSMRIQLPTQLVRRATTAPPQPGS